MTEPRDVLPDAESTPALGYPVPPAEAGADVVEHGAEAFAPPPEPAPTWALALSGVLPGAGHVALGAWARGLAFLFAWALLLAVLFFGWERLRALPETGSLDDAVAAVTLALALVLTWGGALRDLRGGRGQRPAGVGDSQWRIAARHLHRDRLALAGLGIVLLLYAVALLAPIVAPYDPIAQRDIVRLSFLPPSVDYPFGTDRFGRDILSRIIFGARISLSIAFVAVAIAVTLGTLLGAVAGYVGGKLDAALMRFTDMVLAFPRLVLLIMIAALFTPGITMIILVLGLTLWPGTARIVRGEVLSLKEREFVQAARALGMSRRRIILRHLIPNVLAPVIVAATLGIGNTIVLEAGLSFLGLGVQPPTPSWGNMVAAGRENLLDAWWVATFPGLVIVFTVLAFNLIGDGLRDALDPRLRD